MISCRPFLRPRRTGVDEGGKMPMSFPGMSAFGGHRRFFLAVEILVTPTTWRRFAAILAHAT
jgi:hypothetical protein